MNPLNEAIKRAGGVSRLARQLGVTQGAVSGWKIYGGRVPPARVLAVESLTGVSRYVLRPDIFGYSPPSYPSYSVEAGVAA